MPEDSKMFVHSVIVLFETPISCAIESALKSSPTRAAMHYIKLLNFTKFFEFIKSATSLSK